MTNRKTQMCGGEIEIEVFGTPDTEASRAIEEAIREGKRLEKIFNLFDPTSEISQLNEARKIKASKELIEVTKTALKYCEMTNGAYDISKGKLFLARKRKETLPSIECTYKDIKAHNNEISLENNDVIIDLGSIAKGYIADKLAEKLQEEGVISGVIDARGDIIAFGDHIEAIEIQHPRKEEATIGKTTIQNSAVATSGDYNQYDGDYSKSHIIGRADIISATICAKTTIEADAAATCMTVIGSDGAEAFAKKNPQLQILAMTENGEIIKINWENETIKKQSRSD